ncbi:MAG: copper homeostasis protein CutC, partial [Bacteroidales bacterium]
MENKRFLECCCTDAAEAVEAMRGGGVTPGRGNIEETLRRVNIPVNVLIRARGGDFVYDEDEIEAMIGSV